MLYTMSAKSLAVYTVPLMLSVYAKLKMVESHALHVKMNVP